MAACKHGISLVGFSFIPHSFSALTIRYRVEHSQRYFMSTYMYARVLSFMQGIAIVITN